ncbi:lipopolysaccharide biosynthesis protein [Aquisalimonas sp. APHAB1-3]|uniref:lipopolysaccharide biosynthesis protein n=1 Tax=Aquisalimonas sp. APHAB1-3 TaxID=3402080 RepID=UPI003AAF0F4E
MSSVGSKVAKGAAWMVGFRFLQRFIGVISTVILARLLIPEDFGLVAMAMAVYAILELIGQAGFDLALIQNQRADRRHYNTAWTFMVLYGVFSAAVLILLAPTFAGLFGDPRVEGIVYALAVLAVIQGFENIGIVAFRKELQFNKEFWFQVAKKLTAFVVTVALAYIFRSYWALVAGMLASRLTGVTLSYWIHPYRPRLSLAATRDLFTFSGWVIFANLTRYAHTRGPDFIIGPMLGAANLGLFRIAKEISNLPSTQLTFPIMRAVFPGYAKIAHDRPRLQQGFLDTQGMIAMITLPASVGVVVMAEPLVYLMLGSKWAAAIPLMQVLGLYGITKILQGNSAALFMAMGKPYWIGLFVLMETAILLPLLFVLLNHGGLEIAVWANVIGGLALVPPVLMVLTRTLGVRPLQRLAVIWRPFVGAAVMAAAVVLMSREVPPVHDEWSAFVHIVTVLPVAGGTYLATVLLAWWLTGAERGTETRLLGALRHRFPLPGFLR